jgi:hypothetical protein
VCRESFERMFGSDSHDRLVPWEARWALAAAYAAWHAERVAVRVAHASWVASGRVAPTPAYAAARYREEAAATTYAKALNAVGGPLTEEISAAGPVEATMQWGRRALWSLWPDVSPRSCRTCQMT